MQIATSDSSTKIVNRYVSKEHGITQSDSKGTVNVNDIYHKGKYGTSHTTHMPEVNRQKQSNGFATEGKSRKT